MSDLPAPKYRIGQQVWRPQITSTTQQLPCPDCLGSREWRAVAPCGTEHILACPRCTDKYAYSGALDKLPSLQVRQWAPDTEAVTIGFIEARSSPGYHSSRVSYMRDGSGGSVYEEDKLFETREAALTAAEGMAAVENAKLNAAPKAIQARRFSGLQLNDALALRLQDAIFESWGAFRSIGYSLEGTLPREGEGTKAEQDLADAIREDLARIERGRVDYPSIYPTHPVEAMLCAARAGDADRLVKLAEELSQAFPSNPETAQES